MMGFDRYMMHRNSRRVARRETNDLNLEQHRPLSASSLLLSLYSEAAGLGRGYGMCPNCNYYEDKEL